MSSPLLTLGECSERLVHVSEVSRGLACGCICPACKARLVARKGPQLVHHFGHEAKAGCAAGHETALHIAAKEALLCARRIRVPPVRLKFHSYKQPWTIVGSCELRLDRVYLEKREGAIVPDIIAEDDHGKLLVEIYVTHRVDTDKLDKLRTIGARTIEIDLSALSRTSTMEEIQNAVVDDVHCKKWLVNPLVVAVRERVKKLAKFLPSVSRGLARHVDDCPRFARVYRGKPYANIVHDCLYCDYNVGVVLSTGVWCLGATGIETYDDFLDPTGALRRHPLPVLEEKRRHPPQRPWSLRGMRGQAWRAYIAFREAIWRDELAARKRRAKGRTAATLYELARRRNGGKAKP